MKTTWTKAYLEFAGGELWTEGNWANGAKTRIAGACRDEDRTTPTERDANCQRLADCWNACLDLENPAAVPELVAALRGMLDIASRLHGCADPDCGVCFENRRALEVAIQALAKAGVKI